MQFRGQRTLARSAVVRGFGFLTGADITMTFHPADENAGIAFQRVDLPGTAPIPATLDSVVPRQRRTAISNGAATVEMVEHAMAALAGLQIDNCLIQLNAPEPPGGDGSSLHFLQALLEADICEQTSPRSILTVRGEAKVGDAAGTGSELSAGPILRRSLVITYELDYGPRSPIRPQMLTFEFTPETFITNFAFARTFVLEAEAEALKAQGYGTRVKPRDLLIFGNDGIIDNELRAVDECVRHKILDCVGDFALLGCDIHGHFRAFRSGHRFNHEICRQIAEQGLIQTGPTDWATCHAA
ncbi:UDP-3-O-[3-hydroxymyristoyl] N-acetylglucosamine deacetylase [bacterium]|nr:UDP-3-O-[3-hydroxymyristoyl] N-acetylglucosamine deacetylase [bacterium]